MADTFTITLGSVAIVAAGLDAYGDEFPTGNIVRMGFRRTTFMVTMEEAERLRSLVATAPGMDDDPEDRREARALRRALATITKAMAVAREG